MRRSTVLSLPLQLVFPTLSLVYCLQGRLQPKDKMLSSVTTLSIMTLRITTYSIMTLNIKSLYVTISASDNQYNNALLSVTFYLLC
jgi:hypothetical protein